jgi:predicted DNA-binding transcriptional regulator YafY
VHSAKRPLVRRLLTYDRELRAQSFPTAQRLAELTEVDPKTVRRDLSYLRDHYQAPVEFHRARNGWHYAQPTYKLPAVLITEGELLAVFLAGQILRQHQGTPYEEDLQRALHKLEELLPDEISLHWNAIEQAHSFRKSVASLHDVDVFRQLAHAVLHKRQLRLTYWTASRDTLSERTVDPWHLTCIDGEWFLVGYCHTRNDRRMFAPTRIRKLVETGQTFNIPNDFHIAEFFDGAFRVIRDESQPLQTVRLRFAPSAAKYIREKIWHPSQKLHIESDGSALLELALRSLIEIRRFIMSWGSEVEVLAPPALRADIAREAARVAARTPAAATPVITRSHPKQKRHKAS